MEILVGLKRATRIGIDPASTTQAVRVSARTTADIAEISGEICRTRGVGTRASAGAAATA